MNDRRIIALSPTVRLRRSLIGLGLVSALIVAGPTLIQAQTEPDANPAVEASTTESTSTASLSALPLPKTETPVVEPPPVSPYVLEFSRSPVVANRLRLESIYDEARLQFTRPQNWDVETVKVSLRYRHSPALYASRSNLTVLVNGTSVGSIPLNKKKGEIGNVVFNVPKDVLQDYNEVVIAALQNNSPTCTQDPYDPSLWTEIMPDSKVVFDFAAQPVNLDFSTYPYPVFDVLSLEANQLAYLMPNAMDDEWLTAIARFHASMGRTAKYRKMDTRVVSSLDDVDDAERLVVMGTPAQQSALSQLDTPLSSSEGIWLDAEGKPIPDDVGILMLTTTAEDLVPVLAITGNTPAAVAKAAQFLSQKSDRQIATGHVVLVNEVSEITSPSPRQWTHYLPTENEFQLSDLTNSVDQPYSDITVRGSHSPALSFDFRGLPDDQFLPGNTMTLRYSYGPQINPLTSLVEVELDGVVLDGERLRELNGANDESLTVDLPAHLISPNSKIQVNFRLDPRERRSCSRVTDQQLWGTIHDTTNFNLVRENVAQLPNLKLLQNGYPFAAPQDLSNTTMVLPDRVDAADLDVLLAISERLGRLSEADSVQIDAHRISTLPEETQSQDHIIAIGTQADFPFPDVFQSSGFLMGESSTRQWQQSAIQSVPDVEGVLKQVISPWNSDRVLLALSGQSDEGLMQVHDLLSLDPLFYQVAGDTVLINAKADNPSPYSADDYELVTLQESEQQQIVGRDRTNWLRLLRNHWFVLAPGLIIASLILYGVSQSYLKQVKRESQSET